MVSVRRIGGKGYDAFIYGDTGQYFPDFRAKVVRVINEHYPGLRVNGHQMAASLSGGLRLPDTDYSLTTGYETIRMRSDGNSFDIGTGFDFRWRHPLSWWRILIPGEIPYIHIRTNDLEIGKNITSNIISSL